MLFTFSLSNFFPLWYLYLLNPLSILHFCFLLKMFRAQKIYWQKLRYNLTRAHAQCSMWYNEWTRITLLGMRTKEELWKMNFGSTDSVVCSVGLNTRPYSKTRRSDKEKEIIMNYNVSQQILTTTEKKTGERERKKCVILCLRGDK